MATSRPRGFIENWKPRIETEILVSNVKQILDDNIDIAPLTLRQIFYMLVSSYDFDKTEKSYKRLCETMNKARRAQRIPMHMIRDDGLKSRTPHGWDSKEELIETFKSSGKHFRLNRQEGQPVHLMVWCEAAGMLPQLANYCTDYGVRVLSSGGFDSVTTKHNFAAGASEFREVEVLHIGDHDPSGVHMHSSLDEDLQEFVGYYGGSISVTRLAVTPDQVELMRLPTAPPKRTDNRAFEGRTTQAEAIPPRRLKDIVQRAIKTRLDFGIYNEVLERESHIRAELAKKLSDL